MDPARKGIREPASGGLLTRGLLALGLIVGSVPVAVLLLSTTAGGPLTYLVADALSGLNGPWQALRDSLSRLALPFSFLIFVGMLLVLGRGSRRAASVLLATVVLANVTVQAIKHTPVVPARQVALIDALSGHVGVVAGIALGWLVVAPIKTKAVSAIGAVATITAMSFGVVLAGWHTLPQVICPLMICTGWAVAAGMLAPGKGSSGSAASVQLRRGGAISCLLGALGFAVTVVLTHAPLTSVEGLLPSLLTLTGILLLLASLAAVGTVLAVGRTA